MPTLENATLAAATIATGLGAGVYYTYQISVTRALAEVDDDAYVAAFQSINRTIVNPWFVSVFLGAPVLAGVALALHWGADRPLVAAIAAGLVLQVASVAITVAGNIPLNEVLDREGVVTGAAATAARTAFEASWNRLHLARTVAAVGSFVAFGVASVLTSRG